MAAATAAVGGGAGATAMTATIDTGGTRPWGAAAARLWAAIRVCPRGGTTSSSRIRTERSLVPSVPSTWSAGSKAFASSRRTAGRSPSMTSRGLSRAPRHPTPHRPGGGAALRSSSSSKGRAARAIMPLRSTRRRRNQSRLSSSSSSTRPSLSLSLPRHPETPSSRLSSCPRGQRGSTRGKEEVRGEGMAMALPRSTHPEAVLSLSSLSHSRRNRKRARMTSSHHRRRRRR
mmetsp:Transcript_1737/g.3934  ORF Transcript_1737/g.3934 Transcript_1737/m.3934 type:complete len:231 (+) Transcript_1737:379-1071(+)